VLLHDLLGIGEDEGIFLAEESLEDLLSLPVTRDVLSSGIEFDQALLIEGTGVALHLKEPAAWLLLIDRYSREKPVREFAAKLEAHRIKLQEELILPAVTEYFSQALKDELLCQSCRTATGTLHLADRMASLAEFLRPLVPDPSVSTLEIGCGSGMATRSLRGLGVSPWCLDVERCDVCQGLKAGYLDPCKTMVLDARLLSCFFQPGSFSLITGFMVGMITDANWDLWRRIILEAAALCPDTLLFTVYTRPEAKRICKLLDQKGWNARIIDNTGSIVIYDQWACLGRPKEAETKN